MMYARTDEEVRNWILYGDRHGPVDAATADERPVLMPAYRDQVTAGDLDELTAAFKVLSGMTLPPRGSKARRGLGVARAWNCFACHGPVGAGGVANPGSLAGFIPGWYGPAFDDLVRDRGEFDSWIRSGEIPRLTNSRVASYFIRRQRIAMPSYPELTDDDLDDLWAFAQWLEAYDGGHESEINTW